MEKLVKSLSYLLATSLIVFILPANAQAAPNYIYEWVGQNGTISSDGLSHEFTNLQAGQTIQLSLILRNESDYAVRAKHLLGNPDLGRQVPNGSYGIGSQTPYQDGTPSFLDLSSFFLNNNRFVYYEGEDVSHGRDVHIAWTIKLKDNLVNGVYKLYVRPVFEYVAWTKQIKNGQLLPSTNSDIFWKFIVGNGGNVYTDSEIGLSIEVPDNLQHWEVPRQLQYRVCGDRSPSYNVTHLAFINQLNDPYYTLGISLYDLDFNTSNLGDIYSCNPIIYGTYQVDSRTAYETHTGDAGMEAYVFELPGKNSKHLKISFGGAAPIGTFWSRSKINQVLESIDIL